MSKSPSWTNCHHLGFYHSLHCSLLIVTFSHWEYVANFFLCCRQWDHVIAWKYLSLPHMCSGWDVYLRHSPGKQILWAWDQHFHQYFNSFIQHCFRSQIWNVWALKYRFCPGYKHQPIQQKWYTGERQWVYQYYPLSAWGGPWMGCMTPLISILCMPKTDNTIKQSLKIARLSCHTK